MIAVAVETYLKIPLLRLAGREQQGSCSTLPNLLPIPRLYYLPEDRPINRETSSNFIWKASRQRRWWISVAKKHLNQVRIQVLFILTGERVLLVVANFMVSEFFVLAAVQVDKVMMLLESSHNKCYFLFCNIFFFHSLYE